MLDGLYNIMCADYMLEHLSTYSGWQKEVPHHLDGDIATIESGLVGLRKYSVCSDEFYGSCDEHIIKVLHNYLLGDWGELDPDVYDDEGTLKPKADPLANDLYFETCANLSNAILDHMMKGELLNVLDDYSEISLAPIPKLAKVIKEKAKPGNAYYGKTLAHIVKSIHILALIAVQEAGGVKNI